MINEKRLTERVNLFCVSSKLIFISVQQTSKVVIKEVYVLVKKSGNFLRVINY